MEEENKTCSLPTEVYSRVVGYFRPVQNWNAGKKEEFRERKVYRLSEPDSVPVGVARTGAGAEETIIIVEDA